MLSSSPVPWIHLPNPVNHTEPPPLKSHKVVVLGEPPLLGQREVVLRAVRLEGSPEVLVRHVVLGVEGQLLGVEEVHQRVVVGHDGVTLVVKVLGQYPLPLGGPDTPLAALPGLLQVRLGALEDDEGQLRLQEPLHVGVGVGHPLPKHKEHDTPSNLVTVIHKVQRFVPRQKPRHRPPLHHLGLLVLYVAHHRITGHYALELTLIHSQIQHLRPDKQHTLSQLVQPKGLLHIGGQNTHVLRIIEVLDDVVQYGGLPLVSNPLHERTDIPPIKVMVLIHAPPHHDIEPLLHIIRKLLERQDLINHRRLNCLSVLNPQSLNRKVSIKEPGRHRVVGDLTLTTTQPRHDATQPPDWQRT